MREKCKEEKERIYVSQRANHIARGGPGEKQVYEKEGEGKGKEGPLPQKLFFKGKFPVLLQRGFLWIGELPLIRDNQLAPIFFNNIRHFSYFIQIVIKTSVDDTKNSFV